MQDLRPSPTSTRLRIIGVLILALGAIAVYMNRQETFDPRPVLHSSLNSRVLAMELVGSADDVQTVLGDPEGRHNREIMRRLVHLDWIFIATYATLFVALGLVLRSCRWVGAPALGTVAIFFTVAAASADVVENLGILRLLAADPSSLTQFAISTIRRASLTKWGLLAAFQLALALLFLAYSRREIIPRSLTTLAGVAFLAGAFLGFAGLAWFPAIEWSVIATAAGLLIALLVFLCFPKRFLAGVTI